jgi:hypothetical protein
VREFARTTFTLCDLPSVHQALGDGNPQILFK